MSDNPYDSRDVTGEGLTPRRRSRARRLVTIFGAIGVVLVVIALFLPAMRTGAGAAARRMACSNNLKQIALALHNYEDEYHCLPPAYTVDADGRPLHSWRTLILPYFEHQALYDKIDLSKPWNDPVNQRAYDATIPGYRCPATDLPPGQTTYVAIVVPGSCLQPAKPRTRAEITDDSSLTLVVVHTDEDHAVHWMEPRDAGEEWLSDLNMAERLNHHMLGVTVRGDVISLGEITSKATLRALISIDGNDDAIVKEGLK